MKPDGSGFLFLLAILPVAMAFASRSLSGMTLNEMMRLQGFDPDKLIVTCSDVQMGQLLGNSMSVCVLERIFLRLLPSASLIPPSVQLVDRWSGISTADMDAQIDVQIKRARVM